MADVDFPTLDSTDYDLIVTGTGLPASLLAAAAAVAGKSVLHVDPNPFYGFHFASLTPDALLSFLSPSESLLELSGTPPEPYRSFSLDLAGPRLLFCADPMVDLLRRSGACNHVNFNSVDGSLIYLDGALSSVPDSRQAIFRDRSLGLSEKREMMRFLKLVQGHIGGSEDGVRVSDEELETPFVEFLKKQKLPPKIRAIILYAIVLADYDQDDGEVCKELVKTEEGIESIALYIKSVGSLQGAIGAFIYPVYGHGELSQAFCRCAAVKGALYVLRMPVAELLTDEESLAYKGAKLASGQEIFSQNIIIDSSPKVPSLLSGEECESTQHKVARGICISGSSLQQDLSNILVIFPPRSLSLEQTTAVRALQLSSNVAVCPEGKFVVYLSTPCDDGHIGKENIHAAMRALFSQPNLENYEGISVNNECLETPRPPLLWSAVYVQEVRQASFGTSYLCPMPDAHLDYQKLLTSTKKLFSHIYPEEEFLPEAPVSVDDEEDSGPSD